jgi:hypothetical protein
MATPDSLGHGRDRRGIGLGVALVGVGLYTLISRGLGFRGPAPVLLLLGAIFFTLSAFSRFRGPLLPGGVLLGLGCGFALREPLSPWLASWASILLGLGAGFLLVAAIDRALGRRRQPAPVVPGVLLTGIALAEAASRSLPLGDLSARLETLWPFAVVGAGILLVAAGLRKRSS